MDDTVELTQESLAEMLSVLQLTVTATTGTLQQTGLISYHWNTIIRDRSLRLGDYD